MGLFALLARFLPRIARREQRPQFAYVPLAPRRLERRRVLDAAGAGLALEAIPDAQPFVQTASLSTAEDDASQQEPAALHGGLHATIRFRETEVFEDQSALAVVSINDDFPMAHQVTIDWGDGSAVTVINAGVNQRDVLAAHQFLDDPTGLGDGSFTVTATVTNALGESTTTSTTILVKNVAPTIDSLTITSPIDENGTATLTGTYSDPGSLDTHTLDIDWDGNGTFDQSVTVTGGTFSVSRQYLDDNPTGTVADGFNVNVRLRDDDGGQAVGAATLIVRNVAPTITDIKITTPIVENETATLTGTYSDPGTRDTHVLDIDWDGDGTFDETVTVSGGSFSVSRQFLDDNPTGTTSDTFNVNVRLRDDDGGQTVASVALTITNANPVVVLNPIATIEENGTAILTGTYSDAGTLDTHTLDIDWDGDGSFDQTVNVSGGAFTVTRQFLDDNPSGTASDTSVVNVRLRDDDGGVGLASATIEVINVDPVLALVPPPDIDENQFATLNGTITDVGTLDTFTLTVIWGDPASQNDLEFFSLGTTQLTKAADGIDWDPLTRQFSIDHQYVDDIPTNTPLDTYTIQVAVGDDDTGADIKFTTVTVRNVAAELTVADQAVDEGATLDLSGGRLGSFVDQGTRDTHTATVNWGDGSTTQTVTVSELNGSGNLSASHIYADNGEYTVTVTVTDDDGGIAEKTFLVTVVNVNPTFTDLSIDRLEIVEGESINLSGFFEDAGFNDPNGASVESFHYSINWGDGTKIETNQAPTNVDNGGPGVKTSGTLANSHRYTDNDGDNLYTITVTLFDDDGGSVEKQLQVRVWNVNPTLGFVAATDVTTGGIATLTLTFDDPGEEPLTVHIDWGDGILVPYTFQPTSTPRTHTFEHRYFRPPNPTNPAAPITLRAFVTDDDFGIAGVEEPGISNPVSTVIRSPGIGAEPFRIDTTPRVPQLTFPVRSEPIFVVNNAGVTFATQQTFEIGGTSGEAMVAADRYFELYVIDANGNETDVGRLPSNVLDDLPGLFRSLPDNHYAIYVVNTETNVPRLVIEVFVRNGRMIDPGDDSDGTRDRPPTDEQIIEPKQTAPVESVPTQVAPDGEQAVVPAPPSPAHRFSRWTALAVGLAASGSAQSWAYRVDEVLSKATAEQWRKLQGHNPPKPKKP